MMKTADFAKKPHRRFNPLTREWVLVSPQRTQRPWQGKVEKKSGSAGLQYDPDCYLCPGNARSAGVRNPKYKTTFAFENDFPALLPEVRERPTAENELLVTAAVAGTCRVLCFSPRHDLTIARMSQEELRGVVEAWTEEMRSLEKLPWVRHVQIFENRGALMGASNPHPHCQIWAASSIPNIPERELQSFEDYQKAKKSCLLCDYLRLELEQKERIVCENEGFAVVVPFWAVWPFETMILSKRHVTSLLDFTAEEKDLFGSILGRLTTRYDNLFETDFPYSAGLHQRPSGGHDYSAWHFHAHFLPPLLRSATVQKFMVGYELLGMPQRDITPELAAARLAELSETHYLDRH
jgi:UDPglucose--hexose-1-phosphate uridylyltransferase